jgi:hypothetical protein
MVVLGENAGIVVEGGFPILRTFDLKLVSKVSNLCNSTQFLINNQQELKYGQASVYPVFSK